MLKNHFSEYISQCTGHRQLAGLAGPGRLVGPAQSVPVVTCRNSLTTWPWTIDVPVTGAAHSQTIESRPTQWNKIECEMSRQQSQIRIYVSSYHQQHHRHYHHQLVCLLAGLLTDCISTFSGFTGIFLWGPTFLWSINWNFVLLLFPFIASSRSSSDSLSHALYRSVHFYYYNRAQHTIFSPVLVNISSFFYSSTSTFSTFL